MDEEEMEGTLINNEIQHHQWVVFEDNKGGVYYKKVILRSNGVIYV